MGQAVSYTIGEYDDWGYCYYKHEYLVFLRQNMTYFLKTDISQFHPLELPGICQNLYLETGEIELYLENAVFSGFFAIRGGEWREIEPHERP